ncbi:MAG: hypothetical protein K8U57_00580 [Planctomycetes bacterium]|nr:hypothetical protein [Planctomycetota bacterium]
MSSLAERSRTDLVMGLVFDALRVNDARLNEAAAELLTRLGTDPVRRLVREAVSKKNSRPHRLRVMEVLARVGCVSCPEDLLDLSLLLNDRDANLREAARRFLHGNALPESQGVCRSSQGKL